MPDKTCAILQPHYLPWIGYFEMIDRVDVFVFLDDVQFIKREWKNRNRIRKTPDGGESKWLSVPIRREDQRGMLNEALVSGHEDWAAKHLNAVRGTYGRAPFFKTVFPTLEEALASPGRPILSDLNIALIEWLNGLLGITTPCLRSSGLGALGKREEKLLNICKAVEAYSYLANNATAAYVGADYFETHGIGFSTQDYQHPAYPQASAGANLTPMTHLSIIDLLFNVGADGDALDVIRRGRPNGQRQ